MGGPRLPVFTSLCVCVYVRVCVCRVWLSSEHFKLSCLWVKFERIVCSELVILVRFSGIEIKFSAWFFQVKGDSIEA